MSDFIAVLEGELPYTRGQKAKGGLGFTNYCLEGPTSGDLVICFHGLNAALSQWEHATQSLHLHGYRTLRFDLWGHGLSSPIPARPKRPLVDLFMEQAEALLASLQLAHEPLVALGFSLGGYLAAEFAGRNPRVYKCVLLSPAGLISDKPKKLKLLEWRCVRALMECIVGVLIRCLYVFVEGRQAKQQADICSRTECSPASTVQKMESDRRGLVRVDLLAAFTPAACRSFAMLEVLFVWLVTYLCGITTKYLIGYFCEIFRQ